MKTIKQIAEELGVSKQAVQKRISREPLASRIQPHTTNRGQAKYIDEHGIGMIKTAFEGSVVDKVADNPTTKTDNIVYILQRELDVKNRQIEAQSAQISDLTAALVVAQQTAAAAQALHAGTMTQNITGGETDGGTVDAEQARGLWSRLFGKK
jgi:hypothetical protein